MEACTSQPLKYDRTQRKIIVVYPTFYYMFLPVPICIIVCSVYW